MAEPAQPDLAPLQIQSDPNNNPETQPPPSPTRQPSQPAQPPPPEPPAPPPEPQLPPPLTTATTREPLLSTDEARTSFNNGDVLNSGSLAKPSWENWRFRRTLAYWISMFYLEGSILFTVGAAFKFFPEYHAPGDNINGTSTWLPKSASTATVDVPYLVGAIFFTLGGWAGVESVLRLPELRGSGRPPIFCLAGMHHWRRLKKRVSWEPLVAYPAYLIGALLFNVNTVAGLVSMGFGAEEGYVWLPAVLGSVGFVIGGFVECHRNAVWSRFRRGGLKELVSAVVGLSICSAIGGVLFLVAATTGAVDLKAMEMDNAAAEMLSHWLVDGSYLIGSLFFVIGSLCGVWMYKAEQFGLGLVPEINPDQPGGGDGPLPTQQPEALEILSQYGCGKGKDGATLQQLFWFVVYLLNASASVVEIGIAASCYDMISTGYREEENWQRVVGALLNLLLSHLIIVLGAVLHHPPTVQPNAGLLWSMRVFLLMYMIYSWAKVVQSLVHLHEHEIKQHG